MSTNPFALLARYREGWGGVPILENGERTPKNDEQAKEFAVKFCDRKLYYRRWNLMRIARNLSFYKGVHDVAVTRRIIESGTGYALERIKLQGNRRLAVDNCIPEGVDNEVSRLIKKQFEPQGRPTKLLPDLQAASEMAVDILQYDLDHSLSWPAVRGQNAFDTVIGGTGFMRGEWEEKSTDLSPQARPDTAMCDQPGCGTVVASTRITSSDLGPRMLQGPNGAQPVQGLDKLTPAELKPGESMAHTLNVCPMCGLGGLQQHTPVGEDLRSGQDPFGRPLALDVPRGCSTITAPSVFEVWVENGGVGVEPHTNRIWARQSIEDMDSLAARYPEIIPFLTKASMADMMWLNPLMAEKAGAGGGPGFALTGSGVFDRCAILTELVVEPPPEGQSALPGLERGRLIRVICDRVVCNSDLVVDVPFKDEVRQVARVVYGASRYKRIPNEFYGRTPVDDAVPLNFQLDRALTQVEDIRERGVPIIMKPEGAEIEWNTEQQGSLQEVTYRSVAPGFDPQNMIVNGQPLTGNAYMEEINRLRERIRESLGPNASEAGDNVSGDKTARQLEIHVEEAKVKRGPAEESLAKLAELMWIGHLERTWAFRQESAIYEVDDEADTFKQESYTGTDLLGQTRIKIEVANAEDQSVLQATKTQEAIQLGLMPEVMTDPVARDEALTILKVPKLSQQMSVQVKRSEQAWSEFVRDKRVFVIDEDLHDPLIRGQVLGKRWESDEGYQLQVQSGWLTVLPRFAGWRQHLTKLEDLDAKQRAVYEAADPKDWPAIQQQGTAKQEAVVAKNQAAREAGAKAGQPDAGLMDPPPFPQPPPNGTFLPAAVQQRVLLALQDMVPGLSSATPLAMDREKHAQMTKTVNELLPMYAGIQAYSVLQERKAAAAQAGAMAAPAPGGVPGAPPQQAAA